MNIMYVRRNASS